jgi:hypothetical protein
MEPLDTLKAAALEFSNVVRGYDGREPLPELVPGVLTDCRGCTVAATINHGLEPRHGTWEVGPKALKMSRYGEVLSSVPTPPMVSMFLAAFDAGECPELTLYTGIGAEMAGADGLGA